MRRIFFTAVLLFISAGHLHAEDIAARHSWTASPFFDVGYRLVAIWLCVSFSRKLWYGLVERKITSINTDVMDSLLDWSRQVQHRDTEPVRYWIEIGLTIFAVATSFLAAIIGRWQPNT
jgi:hypothetical protein